MRSPTTARWPSWKLLEGYALDLTSIAAPKKNGLLDQHQQRCRHRILKFLPVDAPAATADPLIIERGIVFSGTLNRIQTWYPDDAHPAGFYSRSSSPVTGSATDYVVRIYPSGICWYRTQVSATRGMDNPAATMQGFLRPPTFVLKTGELNDVALSRFVASGEQIAGRNWRKFSRQPAILMTTSAVPGVVECRVNCF